MDTTNIRKAILSQMYIVQAQMDSIVLLIEELEKAEDTGCKHPKEQRLNLTTMGGPEHWECKVCGYEFIAEPEPEENEK